MYEEIPDLNMFMVAKYRRRKLMPVCLKDIILIHAGGMSLTCGKECLSTRKNRRKRFSAI